MLNFDLMDAYEAILARRSVRRFKPDRVPLELLKSCVNAARLAPSGNNRQRLEYVIVEKPALVDDIFDALGWAGYLKPPWRPSPEERPTAYIVIIADRPVESTLAIDVGMAAENILLTAVGAGLAACPIGSIKKEKVRVALNIPGANNIALVVALGYPAEKPIVAEYSGTVKYWRDEDGVHHVPKRGLKSVTHLNKYALKTGQDKQNPKGPNNPE